MRRELPYAAVVVVLVGCLGSGDGPSDASSPTRDAPDAAGIRWAVSRISVSTNGAQQDASAWAVRAPSMTPDGRLVVFSSWASTLVPDDLNGGLDVFLCDMTTGDMERISQRPNGAAPNGNSSDGAISADGVTIAFASGATDLVPGVYGGGVFVYDRLFRQTELVSINDSGEIGLGGAGEPALSADGTIVAFSSSATNLSPFDTNNGFEDIYVRDLVAGTTQLVSRVPSGSSGSSASRHPAISADGRFVAFISTAPELNGGHTAIPRVVVADRDTGMLDVPDVGAAYAQSLQVVMTPDGRYLAFDMQADGFGAFQIVVFDRLTRAATVIAPGGGATEGSSERPTISADGRFVAFESTRTDLVPDDPNGAGRDLFVAEVATGMLTRVAAGTVHGDALNRQNPIENRFPGMSADGSLVVFLSNAADRVQGDTNERVDVFALRRNP